MVVPNAAIEPIPYIAIAVAIAISKWLEDPIIIVITASSYLKLKSFVIIILKPTTITNPTKRGIEIISSRSGLFIKTVPFSEKRTIKVVNSAPIFNFLS